MVEHCIHIARATGSNPVSPTFKMNLTKIIGYILLLLGLGIIIFTAYSSYQIFTGKSQVPQIFYSSSKTASQNQTIQNQIENALQNQLNNIIPASSISQIMNLISWAILAAILIFAGGHISGLGIKLLGVKKEEEKQDE